jgi:valyl-tRNA synthetase
MSKSLGNSPDPIELINKYGADGVRVGMLVSSPAGNDLPFDSSQCEQGRNFTNKMWNAFRLINSWEVKDMEQSVSNKKSIEWFENKFNQSLANINEQYDKFRISDALMATYKLVWDDFCSWYLELIKPGYEQPIDRITKEKTIEIFENLLKVVHPFTPFIAEDLWHLIKPREEGDDIIIATWPTLGDVDHSVLEDFKITADIIGNIRNVRKENNIANKIKIDLRIASNSTIPKSLDSLVVKMGNLQSLEYTEEKLGNAYSFIVKNVEFFIPFGDNVDIAAEKEKIVEELEYTKGFLNSVRKKLGNTNFVSNAPEAVVASEKKKQADAEEKIKILEEKLSSLN